MNTRIGLAQIDEYIKAYRDSYPTPTTSPSLSSHTSTQSSSMSADLIEAYGDMSTQQRAEAQYDLGLESVIAPIKEGTWNVY